MSTRLNKIVPVSEARKNLFKILDRVQKPDTYFVLTVGGRPKAVILSVDEWESILATMDIATDPEMVKAIEKGKKDIEKGRYYSLDEVLDDEGLEVVCDKSAKYRVRKIKRKKGKSKK